MIVAPGFSFSTSRASTTMIWSPNRMCPVSSTTPIRSASPSKPMPRSASVRTHLGDQLLQVLRDRRVRVMRGKAAVDLGVEHDVMAGQPRDQPLQHFSGGTVAVVPDDVHQPVAAVPVGDQPRHIVVGDVHLLVGAGGFLDHVACCRHRAEKRIASP